MFNKRVMKHEISTSGSTSSLVSNVRVNPNFGVNPNFCGKRDFCETGGSIRAGRVNDSSGSFGNRRRDVG